LRSRILYVPEQIELDLSEAELGHPRGQQIIEEHYREGERRRPNYSRSNPAFVCVAHLGGTNPGLFIKRIRGQWWAVHYESGECPSQREPARMSDEHKRQTEYWARAAQDAGWQVELERRLDTGTRPDALIYGPILTGVEVQLSSLTARRAVRRTRKAQRAGVSDVWFTASDIQTIGRNLRPMWAYQVPTVGAIHLPWDVMPPRRSATATGLRRIKGLRCTTVHFDRCPYYAGRGPSHCGRYHPKPEPWPRLTVDDVAGKFPAGEIVALVLDGYQHRNDVFLVGRADVRTWEELTGRPARFYSAPDDNGVRPYSLVGEVECSNRQPAGTNLRGESPSAWTTHRRDGPCSTPGCRRPARLYAGGWRCPRHLPLPFRSEFLGKLPP
jgi:hypothetical protein